MTETTTRPLDGDLIERHLASMRTRTAANHSQYLRQWEHWLAERDGAPALLEVREHHIQAWISTLLDQGQAPMTVRTKAAALRALYGRAHRERLIDQDPTRWVTLPRRPRRSDRVWLDREQLRTLLAAADEHAEPAVRAAVHLWALNGLRPPEPFGIDVTDLSTHDGLPVVAVRARKGGDSDRLSMTAATAAAVRAAVGERTAGPLLVSERTGARLDLIHARTLLRRLIAEHTDLDPRLTPYGLRSTFITLALQAGVPERDVAASAGHATSSQIPVYDRMRATISLERGATHRLAAWLAQGEAGGEGSGALG